MIWGLYDLLMFNGPSRISPASEMARALDSQSFIPRSVPLSGPCVRKMEELRSVSMISNVKLDIVTM